MIAIGIVVIRTDEGGQKNGDRKILENAAVGNYLSVPIFLS